MLEFCNLISTTPEILIPDTVVVVTVALYGIVFPVSTSFTKIFKVPAVPLNFNPVVTVRSPSPLGTDKAVRKPFLIVIAFPVIV